jgi:hypothetical protein
MTNYQKVAGSALGAKTIPEIQLEVADSNHSSKYEALTEQDQINCTKYPNGDNSIAYLAGGTLSIDKADGKLVFANEGDRPTPGALRIDQAASTITSTAKETKLGSEAIKTLNGLIMNPNMVLRPSSNITPEKQWLRSLFPILSNGDGRAILFYQTITIGLVFLIAKQNRPVKTYEEHRSYKDIGTLIIENQDYERKILSGTINRK